MRMTRQGVSPAEKVKSFLAALVVFFGFGPSLALARAPDPTPTPFVVKMDTIRARILSSNLAVQSAYDQVKLSKDSLNVARTDLLPSLSLNGLFSFNAATFAVSAVDFLLPFLFPSNWFALFAQQDLFDAQKLSYQILELNTYSSALALYFTVRSDLKTQEVYDSKADDLEAIFAIEQDFYNQGASTAAGIAVDESNAKLARANALSVDATVANEVSLLRQSLGLPLGTPLDFSQADEIVDTNHLDLQDVQALIDQANKIAPEARQIDDEVKAAKDQQLEGLFGFVSGGMIGTGDGGGNGTDFSNLSGKINVSIGASMFTGFAQSSDNLDMIKLQKTILESSNSQLIESNAAGYRTAIQELADTTQAEQDINQVYLSEKDFESQGASTHEAVLRSHIQVAALSLSKISSELTRNLVLVTLYRALIMGPFADIKGCDAQAPEAKSGGFFDWLFGSSDSITGNLDDYCRKSR